MEGMLPLPQGPTSPIDREAAARQERFEARKQRLEADQAREQLAGRLKTGAQGAQEFLGKYAPLVAGAASVIPGVTTALSEVNAGRPAGALGALAPSALSAVGTGLAMIKHPVAQVAGYGLMGLGALLPGAAASGTESVRQKLTGEPTKGKEGEFSTQMAMNKQLAELGTTQYRDNMGVYTSSLIDLSKATSDQEYLNLQRNLPLINQMKNADLVRQQALMNTQNQGYMQQGVLATAGSLALGAQQNVAQLTNTALQTNPYAGSTIQAPQIRFG
ncbi:hypothetical protein EBT31_07350 [bacterium]|nr:hypothetical protein [bacterium]